MACAKSVLGVSKPAEEAPPAEPQATPKADPAPAPAASTGTVAGIEAVVEAAGPGLEALVDPAAPPANSLPPSEPPPPVLPAVEKTTPFALLPAPDASGLSLLDLSGETAIGPEEAAAAAAAAARVPRVVADDAPIKDEALATVGTEPAHYELDDSDVEEIHELAYPAPTESKSG